MVNRICEQCSSSFNKSPAAINRGEGRFCSNSCRNSYVREHIEERSGENAPKWKGGIWDRTKRSYVKKWEASNRHKSRAHWRVKEAVRSGRLQRKPCEKCGSQDKVHAHHDDYNEPLNVRWLCPKCHLGHHAALRARPQKERNRERQQHERMLAKQASNRAANAG